MARIPDANSLGTQQPNPSRGVQTYQTPAVTGYGSVLSDIGKALTVKAEEDRKRVSDLELSRAQNEYLKRRINTDLEIESEQDYTKWGQIYETRKNESRAAVMGMISDPEVRERANLAFEESDLRYQGELMLKQRSKYEDTHNASVIEDAEEKKKLIQQGIPLEVTLPSTMQAIDSGFWSSEQKARMKLAAKDEQAKLAFLRLPTEQRLSAVNKAIGGNIGGTYEKKLQAIEGDGKNPNSSAVGKYQFVDKTWMGLISKHKPELLKAFTKQQILDMRKDNPELLDEMFIRFTDENRQQLKKSLGREPNDAELYLAHQQGAGGAINIINNPDAKAISVLGKDEVMLNLPKSEQGRASDMTARDFAELQMRRFNGRVAGQPTGTALDYMSPELVEQVANQVQSEWAQEQVLMRQTLNEQAQDDWATASTGGNVTPIAYSNFERAMPSAAEANKAYKEYVDGLEHSRNSFKLGSMPISQREAFLQSQKPSAEGGEGSAREVKQYEDMVTLDASLRKEARDDPQGYAMRRAIGGETTKEDMTPITQAADLPKALSKRKQRSAVMSENFGAPVSYLTNAEIAYMQEVYTNGTPEEKAGLFSKFGDVPVADRRVIAQQVNAKDPALAMMMSIDPKIAKMVSSGDGADIDVKDANLLLAEKLTPAIDDLQLFGVTTDVMEKYMKTIKHRFPNKSNDELADQAIQEILGPMGKISFGIGGESSVILFKQSPEDVAYVDEDDLEDAISSLTDADIIDAFGDYPLDEKGNKVSADDLREKFRMFSVGDGKVAFKGQSFFGYREPLVDRRTGGYFEFDLRKVMEIYKSKSIPTVGQQIEEAVRLKSAKEVKW